MKPTQGNNLKRLFGYRLFFIVNVVVLIFLALSFGREFVRSASIKREIASLEAEQRTLQEQNASLRDYEEYLLTESFLEREAREKFGLQRPGETQVFIDEEQEARALAMEAAQERGAIANWEWWHWYFFDPEQYAAERAR